MKTLSMKTTRKRLKQARVERTESTDIDLNAMMDVVFILLIFFVVTASFIREVALPEYSSTGKSQVLASDGAQVSVTLMSSGRVLVDGRAVDLNAMRAIMSQRYAKYGEALSVVIESEEHALVDTYVGVVDAIRKAKVEKISIKVRTTPGVHRA